MMTFLMMVTCGLLVALLFGLGRVIGGPTTADRMLASQLFGTAGVALLMLLAAVHQHDALLNAALVLHYWHR